MKQRTILFKGLRMDGEGWVEGGVLNGLTIIKVGKELDRYSFISVHPETISQYTGLKDKSGDRIFEGDVVKWLFTYSDFEDDYKTSEVKWEGCGFNIGILKECDIIGNIHDQTKEKQTNN